MRKGIFGRIWGFGVLLVVMISGVSFGGVIWDRASADEELVLDTHVVSCVVSDDGREISIATFSGLTVGEVLGQSGIILHEDDVLFPSQETPISSGMRIFVYRLKTIFLSVGDEDVRTIQTTASDIRALLSETKTTLNEDDFVLPSENILLEDGMEIEVVRVAIAEETTLEAIPYQTKETKDDTLGWRERKVVKRGVSGEKELVYRVVYHNDKEIKRTLMDTHILKEPITEEIVQGTYVQLGKKHTGYGTWYAHTGTLAAASPWLPLGSYAKVTNVANGKSVMVVINDRGPFGENRIIDLDRVAFEKIASLGVGVIEVNVEEVKN
jgi:uncharacterized protein YabE (DUF348 family)